LAFRSKGFKLNSQSQKAAPLEKDTVSFLHSPFNADMVQGKSQAFPADVRRQLVAVASSEASCYPEDDLRPFVRRNSFSDMKELRILDDIVEHYLLRKGTQQ
jgi:hypothetical protein